MTINEIRDTPWLAVISYERLKVRDPEEVQRLTRITAEAGSFFLDLQGPSAKNALADMQPLIDGQRQFFAQSPSVKAAFASEKDEDGFATSFKALKTCGVSQTDHSLQL